MPPPLPESTYRLQFHAGFTFRDAAGIVPYLHSLGVTHCYASPYLRARPGSTHGYDVIDHCSLNPELGTQANYDAWIDAMSSHGMSHILDTVPNHVGVGTNDNAWWNDVLENGRASKYADYFDIAWNDSPPAKVFLPVLGAPLDQVVKKGELKTVQEDGKHWLRYYDRRFPLRPQTVISQNVEDVLNQQHYRLVYWRRASDGINYRRFFDINDLAALRMEREDVFEATHAFTLKLIAEGKVAGLRIDHPDGLLDPEQYLRRLREKSPGLYVVVEKILAPDEPLPEDWPVNGTSGYDFLNRVNGVFIDASNAEAFTSLYAEWIGDATPFEEIVYRTKKLVLETSFAGELARLARRLKRFAPVGCAPEVLRHVLGEMIACFPVYRSYVTSRGVHESDVAHVEHARAQAVARNPRIDPSVFQFIADVLLQRNSTVSRDGGVVFAGKLQQLTAPVTAKGVEDTAFYVYNRFVSLNEVGGEPSQFGVEPETLHAYLADRQAKWPHALSALSTHDTKRSEDVRARLNVLSEMPDEWAAHVKRWGEINARHRDDGAPDRNEEYLLYQTLIGAWPPEPWTSDEYRAFAQRVQAYMVKAMREAKVSTSWTDVNELHENAVTEFIGKLLDETTGGEFLASLRPIRQRVTHLGLLNSLAQTALRLTAPGVPDTYQGSELWDFSLVDPDNRRPVDYPKRQEMLRFLNAPGGQWVGFGATGRRTRRPVPAEDTGLGIPRPVAPESEMDPPNASELLRSKEDGRVKLFVTSRTLALRRENPGLFSAGEYEPLYAIGERASHVFAFSRRHGGRTAAVVVPRLILGLMGPDGDLPIGDVWRDTRLRLPLETMRDVYTGRTIRADELVNLSEILSEFPVALLIDD